MSDRVKAIASRLVDFDQPVGFEAGELFGHQKPFGMRWSIESGTYNLHPRKVFIRNLELKESDIYGVHSRDIFESLHISANPAGVNDLRRNIFNGVPVAFIHASMKWGTHGTLIIETAPNIDSIEVTSGDLGRMMLTDELLYDQGIQTYNRGRMSVVEAHQVATCLGIPIPATA